MPDYTNTQISINQYRAEDDENSMDFEFSSISDLIPDYPPTNDDLIRNNISPTRTNLTNHTNVNPKFSADDDDLTDFEDDSPPSGNPTTSRVEFPANDDDPDLTDIETSPPPPVTTQSHKIPEPQKLDDDYWGNISDELFDSIPLEQLSQPVAKATSVPRQSPPTAPTLRVTAPPAVKKVKFNPKIQYDTDSDEDKDDECCTLTPPSSLNSYTFDGGDNGSKKMEMPAWLTRPTAKDEIKKRVKSNSLFKK